MVILNYYPSRKEIPTLALTHTLVHNYQACLTWFCVRAIIHLMQHICGLRLYQGHETLRTRRLNVQCVRFSRSYFFPGVTSRIFDGLLKDSLQVEIGLFFCHFSIQPLLYSAIWSWIYIMNLSDYHLPIFFISSVSAPETFSFIAPPDLKNCDPTWLIVIPCFSRPSETMVILTFTLMSSSVSWYFVPLSQ